MYPYTFKIKETIYKIIDLSEIADDAGRGGCPAGGPALDFQLPDAFHFLTDFPAAVFDNFRLPGAVGLARGIKEITGILEFVIGPCEVALGFLFRPLLDDEMALKIQL